LFTGVARIPLGPALLLGVEMEVSCPMSTPASLQRRLGAVIAWAAESAQAVANQALEPLGLTVKHFGVMTFLRNETEPPRQGSSLSQQAIGERLRIDRTTMVSLIDDLERAGYVKRERNPDDRRAYVITLTAAGKGRRPGPRRRSTPTPCSSSDSSPRPSGRSSTGCSHASSRDPGSDGVPGSTERGDPLTRKTRRPSFVSLPEMAFAIVAMWCLGWGTVAVAGLRSQFKN